MTDADPTPPPLQPPLQNTSSPRDREPDAADLERYRQWWEERKARKVRGQYETVLMNFNAAAVGQWNLSSSLNIASVRVRGAVRTRESFLGSLIHPIIHSPAEGDDTLENVLRKTKKIKEVLEETDLFSHVEAVIDRSRDALAHADDVDVVFLTKEKGRYYLNTSTQVGNNEGGASATCRIRNAFGGAETFEANVSFATKTRMSFNGSLSAPLTSTLKTRGEVSVFGLERDNSSFASSSEGIRGVRAVVRTNALTEGTHEFGYEAVLRHVGNLTPSASVSMREAAGQSVKSSVYHSWTRDTRDERLLGTRGSYVKFFHELAGAGGDTSFYKTEMQGQLARSLLPGVTLSFAARSGALWHFGGKSCFSDRFQLGGPVSVRMFKHNGMGPHDGADSLGGNLFWSAGATHSLLDNVVSSISKPSISAGVNFGIPLVASKSDGGRKGFQVGIGLDFL
ncbi:surface antigen-domain-containing protein [Epithele typhae]|uniref:surface antigen-domain-containing protein n=1 Tax=Epithele typhae TaxID=378194 RepID=UPI0020082BA6|nr:surface antigen-domain-containing protein [Epithele typhae]KAH9941297.1 surface antigen-domain-containing protein [Epithele typhae]